MLPYGESKQTRLTAAMTTLADVMSEYQDTAWPGQVVYLLEMLQTLGRDDYETRLEALRTAISERLDNGRW
jgi:hypothetical protein